jgi:DNA-binding IclR family transcriptional regulator
MASVGSYVLSINERAGNADVDLKTVCANVLKLLGRAQAPMSFGSVLSQTGFPESLLRDAVTKLQNDRLVEEKADKLGLTSLGYKAHFIVAT